MGPAQVLSPTTFVRCATGAEERELVQYSRKNGARIVPAGNLRSGGNSAESDRQRRSVQRLANMANRVRSAVMLVQQAAAARKVEKRQADQRRADAPQRRSR